MTRMLVLTYYIYKVGDFKQNDYELHRTRSQIMHETGELPSGVFIAVPQGTVFPEQMVILEMTSLREMGPQLKLLINVTKGSMPLQCNTSFPQIFAI